MSSVKPAANHQTAAPKILAIGSANSSLKKLSTKINAFQTNYGPFDCCVVVGNLFKEGESVDSLSSDLTFPIPTYFTHPTHSLSEELSTKLSTTNGEVLPNLIYAGRTGVIRTSNGVGIGFLGGRVGVEGGEGTGPEVLTEPELSSFIQNPSFRTHTLPPPSEPTAPPSTTETNINPTTSGQSSITPKDLSLAEARALAQKKEKEEKIPSWTKGLDVLVLPSSPADSENGGKIGEIVKLSRPRYILTCEPSSSVSNEEEGKSVYEEKAPFPWTAQGQGYGPGREERWTRVVRVDRFADVGEKGKVKGEKKKFFYAFTLPDLSGSKPARPETVGPNPFVPQLNRGTKRPGDEGVDGADGKRMKGEGYVCRICGQPGHHIRDCPDKSNTPRPPPPEYICHRCNQPGHWIKDCPELPVAGVKKEHKMLTMDECWFCLANTGCDTRFIASVHNDSYVALSKGQLIKTGDSQNPPIVPGGGHVLIIPIQHIPNPLLLPEEEARPLLAEIAEIKSQVQRTFEANNAVPVFCDMYRNYARAQHGQIQAIPIPKSRAGEVEDMFRKAAKSEGWDWESGDGEELLKDAKGREFIRIDLPNGKVLVHFIEGKFNLQFARSHLADFLRTPDRANWQVCQTTDEQIKRDVQAFKKAFNSGGQ